MLKAALGGESEPPVPDQRTEAGRQSESVSSQPEPGFPVDFGDYVLLEEIAHGGMGVVFKARQTSLDRPVAIKMLLFGPLASAADVQRFRTEAAAAASLQHPNIVAVHEVGFRDGQHFIAMDYVAGRSLAEIVRDGPLPPQRAAAYVKTIAEAIHYAHERGILHRDLKPSNVLIDENDQPKVTDFGLAKRLEKDSELTLSGQVLGSPSYMAPEQAAAHRGLVGKRSDVYALGAILYHLLTGRPPFVAPTIAETLQQVQSAEPVSPTVLNPGLPRDLKTICLKCLEKEPTRRYQSAQELADELGRFLNQEPILARPVSRPEKLWRWCRRKPLVASLSLAVSMLLLVVLIGSPIAAWRINRARQLAQDRELQARRTAYVSDMKAAQVALQQNNRGMAMELLRRYLPTTDTEDLRGLEWRYLWQESQGDELQTFPHPSMVHTAALTADGRQLVTAGHDGKTRVWDIASAKVIQEFEAHGPFGMLTKAVGLSPDGKWLAFQGKNGVEVRDAARWNLVQELKSAMAPLAFSPDGKRLAVTVTNGLEVWELGSWNRRTLTTVRVWRNSLAFTPNGDGLAYGTEETNLRFWELQSGIDTRRFPVGNVSLAISPDGKWLAAGTAEGEVWLWDLPAWQFVIRFQAQWGRLYGLAFSPDGTRLATGGNDQLIHLWETGTTNRLATFRGHLNEIWSLEFSRDGQTLVSASKDGTAKLWSVKPALSRASAFTVPTDATPLGLLPDGTALVTLDKTQRVTRLWRVPDGQLIASNAWNEIEEEGCQKAVFLPTSQTVVGVGTNGMVHLWNLTTKAHMRSIQLEARSAWPFLLEGEHWLLGFVSQDQCWLLGVGEDRKVRLYDLRAARQVQQFPAFDLGTSAAAFSPDGRWLAHGTTNCGIRIWDLASRREKVICQGHLWHVYALRFSPDSKILASGAWDAQVRLWSVETGTPLHPPLKGHQSGVIPIAFSADGKTLVTGSDDRTIRWWNVATGNEMLLFPNALIISKNLKPEAELNPGGDLVVWQEYGSAIRVTTLPTMAQIDASEKARIQSR